MERTSQARKLNIDRAQPWKGEDILVEELTEIDDDDQVRRKRCEVLHNLRRAHAFRGKNVQTATGDKRFDRARRQAQTPAAWPVGLGHDRDHGIRGAVQQGLQHRARQLSRTYENDAHVEVRSAPPW